jgi:hypothetical protein
MIATIKYAETSPAPPSDWSRTMDKRPITVRLRELATRDRLEAAERIEALEAALRGIADVKPAEGDWWKMQLIARAALAPEQDK